MSAFTSFIAVEERVVNHNGTPKTVQVPVSVPDDAARDSDSPFQRMEVVANLQRPAQGGGGGGGGGGRVDKNDNFKLQQPIATTEGDKKSRKVKDRYGDPNSKSAGLTNGRGQGSGYGTGSGSGSGSGNGPGNASPPPPIQNAVTVTADSTLMAQATTVGTSITGRQIVATPVRSRDALSLLTLLPGTSSGAVGFLREGDNPNDFDIVDPANRNGSIRSRAIVVVDPVVADPAKTVGEVEVNIEIDATGSVVSAKAISGPELLRAGSEDAAKATRFAKPPAAARMIRSKGVITYKFTGEAKPTIFVDRMEVIPLTEDDKREQRIGEIFHFRLYDLVARTRRGVTGAAADDLKFVRDGNARIRIERSTAGSNTDLALVGFEVDHTRGNSLTGRIPVANLAKLADIREVKYVSPIY